MLRSPTNQSASNATKSRPFSKMQMETYETFILQQQQLLQWQLESQHPTDSDGPNISPISVVKAPSTFNFSFVPKITNPSNSSVEATASFVPETCSLPFTVKRETASSSSSVSGTPILQQSVRLEDMKVPELKAECKRLNLPCSGPKPVLIDRLQHYANSRSLDPDVDSSKTELRSQIGSTEFQNENLCLKKQNLILTMPVEGQKTRPGSVVPMDVEANQNVVGYNIQNSEQVTVKLPYLFVKPQHHQNLSGSLPSTDSRNQTQQTTTKKFLKNESSDSSGNGSFIFLPQTVLESNQVRFLNCLSSMNKTTIIYSSSP